MAAQSNKPVIFESEQPCKDGSRVWVEISVWNFIDEAIASVGIKKRLSIPIEFEELIETVRDVLDDKMD